MIVISTIPSRFHRSLTLKWAGSIENWVHLYTKDLNQLDQKSATRTLAKSKSVPLGLIPKSIGKWRL